MTIELRSPVLRVTDLASRGGNFYADLRDTQYSQLKHDIMWMGGAWRLSFFLPAEILTSDVLADMYDMYLMKTIEEKIDGKRTWKGFISELSLIDDGAQMTRSIWDMWNAVSTVYTINDSQIQTQTGFAVNAQSIAEYGRRENLIYMDNVTVEQATTKAQTQLVKWAEPDSKQEAIYTSRKPGLYVEAIGEVVTANNQYTTVTTQGEENISTFITSIIETDCEFLSPGRIATNSLVVEKEQREPTRAWDLLQRLASMGDGVTPYRIWVDDGLVHYQPVDNTPEYYWWGETQGGLTDRQRQTLLWDMQPGIMRNLKLRSGTPVPGSLFANRQDTLIQKVTMAQKRDHPGVYTDPLTDEQLGEAKEDYARWESDLSFDPLHTLKREDL